MKNEITTALKDNSNDITFWICLIGGFVTGNWIPMAFVIIAAVIISWTD